MPGQMPGWSLAAVPSSFMKQVDRMPVQVRNLLVSLSIVRRADGSSSNHNTKKVVWPSKALKLGAYLGRLSRWPLTMQCHL